MINFLQGNSKNIKKILSISFTIFFFVFGIIELSRINFKEYSSLFLSLNYLERFEITLFGLIAFLFGSCYDFILCKYFNLDLKKSSILKVSFVAQGFNNFLSFGGLAGAKIRVDMFGNEGVDRDTTFKISLGALVSEILGLIVLIIPALYMMGSNLNKYIYLLAILVLYIPAYFLLGKFKPNKLKNIADKNFPYSFLDSGVKTKLLLGSIVDWVVVALFFSQVVRIINPEISINKSVFVYVIATLIGILSFIPGGLGSFDLTAMVLFGSMGYSTSHIFISLVIYRISYYVVPWLISVSIYVVSEFKNRTKKVIVSQQVISIVLSILIFFSGLTLILSAATPEMLYRIRLVDNVFPMAIREISRGITIIIGILLIVMSRGIALKIKRVYKLSLYSLLFGAMLCIFKGFDYEETFILLLYAFLLYISRDIYNKEHVSTRPRDYFSLEMTIFIVLVLYVVIYNITHDINFYYSEQAYSVKWLMANPLKVILFLLFLAFVLSMFMFTRKKYLQFEDVSEESIGSFVNFMKDYSGNHFTHMFFTRDKNYFINSKNTVLMQYRTRNDNLIVLGDPVGLEDDFEESIDEIIDFAESYDMKVSFYEVLGKNLEIYSNQGFSAIKLGEEATVNLSEFSLEGNKNKNLRRIEKKMESGNYKFEFVYPPFEDSFLNRLKEISDSWLGGKEEMGYSIGRFDRYYLNCAPIAILKNEEDMIFSFATFFPIVNTKKFSVDLMRFDRENSIGGEMDMLFISLLQWGKENGYESFYFGMAPLSNVGTKRYSGTKERVLKLVYEYGNQLYSFKGLRSYKEKFHPKWSGRYLIYKNDINLPDILISLLHLIHHTNSDNEI
ncbi:phosphatidylglycerol lysyltransferase [Anaerosphaera aminiphila DSM 21120]|uniref:Phosphatidylglycerol lysyltransferase n=1 Tax=Anaerosphaera aminiphila DSM 21120 TaxID=1120995 RepID=A0A1M5QV12_9FIRM|nr:bifunctional lysylphosphatidylglycerol flippase/synthetase MprF [Anaerosphaera aminiphila]SHH17580.1 phosphatidylglycerol lysyltransferase [Anaerosphaera aminiphila DSM 21120]